tara:strand:- start:1312 stop:1680 length:369 start_codon:yes stop_codon:yes gene_type:complete
MGVRKIFIDNYNKKNMKKLRFSEPLPGMVLSGEKNTTWRIDDEKKITVNNELSLCKTNNEEFGIGKVQWIKMTTFGNLTKEDLEGHEKFSSSEEMYKTYSSYYNIEVKPETVVKIIKFKLKN